MLSVLLATGLMAPMACSNPDAGGATPEMASNWQYQLRGRVDTEVAAGTFDIDLFDTPTETVTELRTSGRTVICYLNAGAVESWRPDADLVPPEVRGIELEDWPGEYWLDIRRLDVLEPYLAARFDLCRSKGFDAVEPDNVDGYMQETGFPLTDDEQLAFNRMLARLAHARGLEVGLKNDLDQVDDLVDSFDFAVNEQCAQYDECDRLEPFVAARKPVFHVEYELPVSAFCPPPTGFLSIRKPILLGPEVTPCPAE